MQLQINNKVSFICKFLLRYAILYKGTLLSPKSKDLWVNVLEALNTYKPNYVLLHYHTLSLGVIFYNKSMYLVILKCRLECTWMN